jgi:hypothetical protein
VALLHVTQLYAGLITNTNSASPTLLYTVPTGYRIVLRSLNGANKHTAANGIVVNAPDPNRIWFANLAAFNGVGSTQEDRPWIVLSAGQTIKAYCGNANGVWLVVSGSLYFV